MGQQVGDTHIKMNYLKNAVLLYLQCRTLSPPPYSEIKIFAVLLMAYSCCSKLFATVLFPVAQANQSMLDNITGVTMSAPV